MEDLKEIEGESGLYKVSKAKQLYYLGYGENIAYIINLDTLESKFRRIK